MHSSDSRSILFDVTAKSSPCSETVVVGNLRLDFAKKMLCFSELWNNVLLLPEGEEHGEQAIADESATEKDVFCCGGDCSVHARIQNTVAEQCE